MTRRLFVAALLVVLALLCWFAWSTLSAPAPRDPNGGDTADTASGLPEDLVLPRRERGRRRSPIEDVNEERPLPEWTTYASGVVRSGARPVADPESVWIEVHDGTRRQPAVARLGSDPYFSAPWTTTAGAPPFRVRAVHDDGRVSAWVAPPVPGTSDPRSSWLVLQFHERVSVRGRVVDADGRPVPGARARLSVHPTSDAPLSRHTVAPLDTCVVETDAEGRYAARLARNAAATCSAAALGPGGFPGPATGGRSLDEAEVVLDDAVDASPTACRWTIRFVDPSGAPLTDVAVRCEFPDAGALDLGSDATRLLAALRGGEAIVDDALELSLSPHVGLIRFIAGRSDRLPMRFTFGKYEPGEYESRITLAPRYRALVRVVGPDGAPLLAENHDLRVADRDAGPDIPVIPLGPNQSARQFVVQDPQEQRPEWCTSAAVRRLGVDLFEVSRATPGPVDVQVCANLASADASSATILGSGTIEVAREPSSSVQTLRLDGLRRLVLELPLADGSRSLRDLAFAVWLPNDRGTDEPDASRLLWCGDAGTPLRLPPGLDLIVPKDSSRVLAGFVTLSRSSAGAVISTRLVPDIPPHRIDLADGPETQAAVPDRLFRMLRRIHIQLTRDGRPVSVPGLPVRLGRARTERLVEVESIVFRQLSGDPHALDGNGALELLLPPGAQAATIADQRAGAGTVRFDPADLEDDDVVDLPWTPPGE